jgi:hypothetical protein
MIKHILFLDDEKIPEWFGIVVNDLVDVATSYIEAVRLINNNTYQIMYLDHDIGSSTKDGSIILQRYMQLGRQVPQKVYCISWNPVGVERIRLVCEDWNIPFEAIGRL